MSASDRIASDLRLVGGHTERVRGAEEQRDRQEPNLRPQG